MSDNDDGISESVVWLAVTLGVSILIITVVFLWGVFPRVFQRLGSHRRVHPSVRDEHAEAPDVDNLKILVDQHSPSSVLPATVLLYCRSLS
jgi:hypothetical protein